MGAKISIRGLALMKVHVLITAHVFLIKVTQDLLVNIVRLFSTDQLNN